MLELQRFNQNHKGVLAAIGINRLKANIFNVDNKQEQGVFRSIGTNITYPIKCAMYFP